MKRRSFWCALLATVLAVPTIVAAQNYPNKPIRMLVGFAPGGPADTLARIVGLRLSETLKQPIVIENRAGAAGTIAAAAVAKATPDGYTLFLVSSGHAGNATYYPKLPYDTVKDFAAVGGVAASPIVILVGAASPYKSLADLMAAARAKPGALNCATGGGATLTNLAVEQLKSEAKIDVVNVPYKGSGPVQTALMSGEVDFGVDTISSAIGLIQSGKLRALAVTSLERSSVLPNVPTASEQGVKDFEVTGWFGILAPAGTPAPVVKQLNDELNHALNTPDIRQKLAGLGADSLQGSPEKFGKLLADETARWAIVISKLNLKAE